MVEIEEMTADETHALLRRVGYGHLGCAHENRPYVLPIHFAYDEPDIYIFTTKGMKTEFIDQNPEVCLQVEEIDDPAHWKSVILTGQAEFIKTAEEGERAMSFISQRNPTLTPAISKMWIDAWGRANVTRIYRIRPATVSGRKTI